MMFKTHLAFGFLVGLFFADFFDLPSKTLFITIVTLAAILPDIDTPFSKVGGKFPILSWIFNLLFGHRGLMHTIYFPLLVYLILESFQKSLWAGAFLLGYMSHLFTDMLTIQGIHFFYPINKTRINGFIKSGGLSEWIFFVLVLIGIILVFLN